MSKSYETINHNGTLKEANQALFNGNNRAFRYGDGLFESIRVFNGAMPLLAHHIDRLFNGLVELKFTLPDHYSTAFFEQEIQKLLPEKANARIRLSLYRIGGGLYEPKHFHPEFLIQAQPLETKEYIFPAKGLEIGLYQETLLNCHSLSNLKTINSLPYIMGAIYRSENGLDECIMLNNKGWIAGCSSANIFLIQDNILYTPPLSEGGIAGIMRSLIIELSPIEVRQIPVHPDSLEKADEVFLTNAIQGIKWVKSYKNATFGAAKSKRFLHLVNQHIHEKTAYRQ